LSRRHCGCRGLAPSGLIVRLVAPNFDRILAAEGAMPRPTIPLLAADAVSITIVTDNSFDLLMASTDVAHRLPLGPNPFEHPLPIAEHGFSVLIEVRRGDRRDVEPD
jgi:hypothetical protein